MCFSIGKWKIASSCKLRRWWEMGMHLLPNLVGLDNMWRAIKLWASHDQKPITRKGFTLRWEPRKRSGTVCLCFSLTIGEGSLTFSPFLAEEKTDLVRSVTVSPSQLERAASYFPLSWWERKQNLNSEFFFPPLRALLFLTLQFGSWAPQRAIILIALPFVHPIFFYTHPPLPEVWLTPELWEPFKTCCFWFHII